MLLGESSLRRALQQYMEHYQGERNHPGQPSSDLVSFAAGGKEDLGAVRCRERLGGLLKYYAREVA